MVHGEKLPGVSTTNVIDCQGIHTHTLSMSQCLVRSADSLNCEVQLLLLQQPEGSESEATEAVELQEQVILQETSWSCPQGLLLPLQQRAFLTRAQTLHLCHPGVKPSLLLPLRLLYPAKDVVKQNS